MKNAIISGGMGDIGKAIAQKLAHDGLVLTLLTHTTSSSEQENFIASLEGTGHKAYTCDITNAQKVREIVEEREKEIGYFTLCIHAAVGSLVRAYAASIQESDFKAQFNVGLFGGLNLFQSVLPGMKRNSDGHIIGITSQALWAENPTKMAGYTSAKFALHGLLRELSKELHGHGIRVNAVAPGFVPTKLHSDIPSRAYDFIAHSEPNGTLTSPDDVAQVVSYICSDAANHISGMTYPVRSGEPIRL